MRLRNPELLSLLEREIDAHESLLVQLRETLTLLRSLDGQTDTNEQIQVRVQETAEFEKRRREKSLAKRKTGPAGGRVRTWDYEKGRRLWDTDMTAKEIAKEVGCSLQTLKSAAHRQHWPKRTGKARARPLTGTQIAKGRTQIPPTRCPSCENPTMLNPCAHCHTMIAPGAIGKP